jgi:hypothetical protein
VAEGGEFLLQECATCARRHGNGTEPPVDWPPLVADHDGSVWGVVCPDCRVKIGDAVVITLRVARPWLRVVPSPDAGDPADTA